MKTRLEAVYLINLLIGEVFATGNVFACHSLVHISLDGAWRDGVDGNLFRATVDCL